MPQFLGYTLFPSRDTGQKVINYKSHKKVLLTTKVILNFFPLKMIRFRPFCINGYAYLKKNLKKFYIRKNTVFAVRGQGGWGSYYVVFMTSLETTG